MQSNQSHWQGVWKINPLRWETFILSNSTIKSTTTCSCWQKKPMLTFYYPAASCFETEYKKIDPSRIIIRSTFSYQLQKVSIWSFGSIIWNSMTVRRRLRYAIPGINYYASHGMACIHRIGQCFSVCPPAWRIKISRRRDVDGRGEAQSIIYE